MVPRSCKPTIRMLSLLSGLILMGSLTGCGDSNTVTTGEVSPEAKKADEGVKQGMRDYMQSKGKMKPTAK